MITHYPCKSLKHPSQTRTGFLEEGVKAFLAEHSAQRRYFHIVCSDAVNDRNWTFSSIKTIPKVLMRPQKKKVNFCESILTFKWLMYYLIT